ncbi:MAG TPA: DoxX family protein [Bacteroidia bacterium]|nr:DoxX family protein [Bacteroidia bacterium]
MKKTNIIYWISTGLFAAVMLFSAVPDVLNTADAVSFMSKLGYPSYFTPFIGLMKVLGVAALLVPGFPRVKEWAYAGLAFDLLGAVYSVLAVGTPPLMVLPMALFIAPGVVSYIFWRKKTGAVHAQ